MNSNHKKFVLCVDDDQDDRLVISEAIRDIDPSLEVIEAKNGIEAYQLLQNAKSTSKFPCLVILDINMPMMDGKETLRQIKSDDTLRSLPIVFFTTSANPATVHFLKSMVWNSLRNPPTIAQSLIR